MCRRTREEWLKKKYEAIKIEIMLDGVDTGYHKIKQNFGERKKAWQR